MSQAMDVLGAPASKDLPVDDIQGNVLRGYGFPMVMHLFGRIDGASAEAWRTFLGSLVEPGATIVQDGGDWGPVKPETTVNVGLDFGALVHLCPEAKALIAARYPSFAAGMAARADALLDDATPAEWAEWNTRHVWVNVHARSEEALGRRVRELEALAQRAGVSFDAGHLRASLLPGGDGNIREHFGFRDGLANPAIDGDPGLDDEYIAGNGRHDANGKWFPIAPGEFVIGHQNERRVNVLDGVLAPLSAVLRNGTFAVLRDLEQHAERFQAYVEECARQYGYDADFFAHKMMGRTRDGAPLTPGASTEDDNVFNYRGDRHGAGCPIGAHIRRTNPRDTGERRLLRRSLPYVHPDGRKGLYFLAMNASVEEQFEFVQTRWVNGQAGFLTNGRDPVATTKRAAGNFAVEGDVGAKRPPMLLCNVPAFVTCHGGQYYFVPGIAGLRALTARKGSTR